MLLLTIIPFCGGTLLHFSFLYANLRFFVMEFSEGIFHMNSESDF